MHHYETKDLTPLEVHKLVLGGIAPRPIALVSTLSEDGIPNLSPFSFFNVFGYNPPVIAFSPSRRGRDSTLKDTYNNLVATKECVVQSVTYAMVEQVSLASTEYSPDVNEFIKSGLTPIDSDLVKPKRVKESPFQMECKLLEMLSFGDKGGSANMAICEVIKFHVAEDIFKDGHIQPDLIDLVSRMSANYYCRASGDAVFEVEKSVLKKGIGFDNLPAFMKESHVYTANNLGKFANVETIPAQQDVNEFINEFRNKLSKNIEALEESFYEFQRNKDYKNMFITALQYRDSKKQKMFIELSAKCALENNDNLFAWKAALSIPLLNL